MKRQTFDKHMQQKVRSPQRGAKRSQTYSSLSQSLLETEGLTLLPGHRRTNFKNLRTNDPTSPKSSQPGSCKNLSRELSPQSFGQRTDTSE